LRDIGWISVRVPGVLALALVVSAVGIRADDALVAVHTTPNQSTASPASPIVLPLEVLGPDGTTVTTQFTLPDGPHFNKRLKLWMEIHALKYETEASFQLNGRPWTPINSSTVSIQGLGGVYGGFGGGFSTLKMIFNLRLDEVHPGVNTLAFRFNGTDGIRSGFRVLAFNVLASNGAPLIPQTSFAQDDPSKWQPPFTSPADIQAGKTLWNTAGLTAPGVGVMQAKCSSCHAQDGRDLKYFNYSNLSIRARSMFHGLSAQQGDQIASYIRSLNLPSPGRPWNPPYQPGPGLDSQPVANWAAGAGLDAVLNSDAEIQPYLLPGGSDAKWSSKSYLNPRELPIPLQLPDWNSWLPQVHPMDAFGERFTSSALNTDYAALRSTLQPNTAAAYQNGLSGFNNWFVASQSFLIPRETNANWDADNHRAKIYSVALWLLVKQWELNQEFGLEAMPQVPFGSTANPRGWYGNLSFNASPVMLHIPAGPGLGNGSVASHEYLVYVWYHLQMLLNDGQGHQSDNSPFDYGYVEGGVKDLSAHTGNTPTATLELLWLVKALQENTLKGYGPQYGFLKGFAPLEVSPIVLVHGAWESDWSATSPATRAALTTAYVKSWFAQISSFTSAAYYQGKDGGGRPWASATENPATDDTLNTVGGQVWYMLPRLRYVGVDPTLTYRISAWAATVWPAGNWALNDLGTCTELGKCTSD
jgi:cytochrome c553